VDPRAGAPAAVIPRRRAPASALEVLRDFRPSETLFDQPPPSLAQLPAAAGIAEERKDLPRELGRLVRPQEMDPGNEREAFSTDGRRDHGLPRRQRLVDLQARSA